MEPAEPVKLVPLGIPPTPTVSNNNKAASRHLVKNIQFQLQVRIYNFHLESYSKSIHQYHGIDVTGGGGGGH